MDLNLDLYRSISHLPFSERRKRVQHLSKEERNRVRIIVEREEDDRRLEEDIAGRDLVEVALADPSEMHTRLKLTLLGRTIHSRDESTMVKRITNNLANSGCTLISYAARFDHSTTVLPLDAWKLVYCDLYYIDGCDATLQQIYEARLREEDLQTPAARARELVRDNNLKKARRNARWMIPALERPWTDEDPPRPNPFEEAINRIIKNSPIPEEVAKLFEDHKMIEKSREQWKKAEPKRRLETLWNQVSPAPPAWMKKVLDDQVQFGFIYYLSREANGKYGHHWKSEWLRIDNTCAPLGVCWSCIHTQGKDNWFTMHRLEAENWPVFSPDETLAEDDDLRKHFKQYSEKNKSDTKEDRKMMIMIRNKNKHRRVQEYTDVLSPGFLRNTFIVIPIELVDGNRSIEEGDFLDPCWVWAYDADWDSSQDETVFNGEKYQGRVKVAKWSLNSWFYGARWEGVSLRDMWLKAQQHPEKMWICYAKEFEEWDHEPYI
ncbi:hypothetical protein NW768_007526 [Fusarium equiseti]|uniref:Uncharacterized protein n=1 Tax=Fusarium equiseti TaxID=61235 RepID=A0ABQ8R7W1_FUSEQ|nr:hypothetical protein NW768_007526 [Fusarium equiseti]